MVIDVCTVTTVTTFLCKKEVVMKRANTCSNFTLLKFAPIVMPGAVKKVAGGDCGIHKRGRRSSCVRLEERRRKRSSWSPVQSKRQMGLILTTRHFFIDSF